MSETQLAEPLDAWGCTDEDPGFVANSNQLQPAKLGFNNLVLVLALASGLCERCYGLTVTASRCVPGFGTSEALRVGGCRAAGLLQLRPDVVKRLVRE